MRTLRKPSRAAALLSSLALTGCVVTPRQPVRHHVEVRNAAPRPVVLEHTLDPEWSTCDVEAEYHEIAPGDAKRLFGTGTTTFVCRPIEDSGHWGKPSAPINLVAGRWVMTVRQIDDRLLVSLDQVPELAPSRGP